MSDKTALLGPIFNVTVNDNVPEGALFIFSHPTSPDEKVRMIAGKTLEEIVRAYIAERRVVVAFNAACGRCGGTGRDAEVLNLDTCPRCGGSGAERRVTGSSPAVGDVDYNKGTP